MLSNQHIIIAQEVLKGKWGNGIDRVERLTKAGYDADEIQRIVNDMYIHGEVTTTGDYTGPIEKVKEIEIDMRGYDALSVTLVV